MSCKNYGSNVKLLLTIKEFKNQIELFPGISAEILGNLALKILGNN